MTEIIEGQAVDVTPTTSAVATVQQGVTVQTGSDPLRYLGLMPEAKFLEEMAVIRAGTDRIMAIHKNLLREDIDYGVIPGTKVPTLLQPGAERLAMIARLIPRHEQRIIITPVPGHPDRIDVHTQTFLHFESLEGPVKGSAVASCSSYEDRYRWRTSERACPTCKQPSIIKGNPKYGGGWVCWAKKGGCGAKFPEGYQPIETQTVGKVENEEPHALINTIVQISAKRGFVGAVRHTLGITDLFTQDVEDMPEMMGAPQTAQEPAATPPRANTPAAPAPRQGTQPAAAGTGVVTFEGPVVATPDGIRATASGRVLAFAIKVGNSKHNVDLWDDLAAAAQPHITEGTRIRVDGRRVEEDWPGRGDKPMKKVIKDVTSVWTVDGSLVSLVAQAVPKAPQPVQSKMDYDDGAVGDERASFMPKPDDGPPLFDDEELPFDSTPASFPEPVKATGDPKASADVTGSVRVIEWRQTPQGADYVALEVVHGGVWYDVAVGKDDALVTFAPAVGDVALTPGQRVRVIGGWSKSGALIIAGIVAPA